MKFTIFLIFLLAGCASTTEIIMPDKDIVYTIKTKSDGKVEFDDGKVKIIVDNTGRPTFFEKLESLVGIGVMKSDINVNTGNQPNED